MISMTRLTRKTMWLYCLISPLLMWFFISKGVSIVFLTIGLLTLLNFEDKIYNIKKQKNAESEEHNQ